MNNCREAKFFMADALLLRDEAGESNERGHYHRVVRKCQEAVELALKALLLHVGIEYPKAHDVSMALASGNLKGQVADEIIEEAVRICKRLGRQRGPAFYGTETVPAAEMFDKKDADHALADCDTILRIVSKYADAKT